MEELIHKLGIEPKLLIAQIINFGVLLLLLYKFLYRPILTMLQKRENYIKKSLEDAKDIKKQKREFEELRSSEMKKVKAEANTILEKAVMDSEKIKDEAMAKARSSADELVEKAKKDITIQKEQALIEARKEMGDLIVLATQEVSGKIITGEDEKRLIEETLGKLGKKDKREMYANV